MTSTPLYRSTREGFTLIELLVVVAIIGLLSSVILASLGSARSRARVAQAQTAMTSGQKIAVVCTTSGTPLGTPGVGTAICTGAVAYPPLPTASWSYPTSGTPCRNSAGVAAAIDTTTSDGTFLFCTTSATDGKTVSCHETGCRTD